MVCAHSTCSSSYCSVSFTINLMKGARAHLPATTAACAVRIIGDNVELPYAVVAWIKFIIQRKKPSAVDQSILPLQPFPLL